MRSFCAVQYFANLASRSALHSHACLVIRESPDSERIFRGRGKNFCKVIASAFFKR